MPGDFFGDKHGQYQGDYGGKRNCAKNEIGGIFKSQQKRLIGK